MSVKKVLIVCSIMVVSIMFKVTAADNDLVFYLPFEGNADAQLSAKRIMSPTEQKDIEYVPGIKGQAVIIRNEKSKLLYNAEKLFNSSEGTVMFWVQPQEDLVKGMGMNTLLNAKGSGKENLNVRMNGYSIGASLTPNTSKEKYSQLNKWIPNSIFAKEWHHLAVVWEKDGLARLYLDGENIDQTNFGKYVKLLNWHPKNLKTLQIGHAKGKKLPFSYAIDEVKIYNKALPKKQIEEIYRNVIPFDFIVYHRFIAADRKEVVPVEIRRWGNAGPALQDTVDIVIEDKNGKVVWQKNKPMKLKDYERIGNDIPPLSQAGDYYINMTPKKYKHCFRRRKLSVYDGYRAPRQASDKDFKTGAVELEIDCTQNSDFLDDGKSHVVDSSLGKYRESGPKRMDKFGYEFELKKASVPYLLEVTYPDDKPRTFDCLISHTFKKRYVHDVLGAGEICGRDYPNTGKLRTVRYIFWPDTKDNLIEFTCRIDGEPAAIARLRISPIIGRLPRLKIRKQGKSPFRFTGLWEEDLVGIWGHFGNRFGNWPRVIMRFADYLEYIGSDVFMYNAIHYWKPVNFDGISQRAAHIPYGFHDLLIRTLGERKIKFIGTVDCWSLPKYFRGRDRLFENKGQYLVDKYGQITIGLGAYKLNPAYPEIAQTFTTMTKDAAQYYSQYDNFGGMQIFFNGYSGGAVLSFGSIDSGYGDFTVKLFEKETGIKVPGGSGDDRFIKRYQFLTNTKMIDKWLAWRGRKVTAIIKQTCSEIRQYGKNLKIYLSLRECNPEMGVDINALRKIEGLYLGDMYRPSMQRHQKLKLETDYKENKFDPKKYKVLQDSPRTFGHSYHTYWEWWKDSLLLKKYPRFYKNSDIKPAGRAYLESFQRHIEVLDPAGIVIGGIAVSPFGRESEMREFTKAFSALPASKYQNIKGLSDPVRVRSLKTEEGTYIYLANRFYMPVKTTLSLLGKQIIAKNLSSGKKDSVGKVFEIVLKSYELKSFLLTGEGVQISEGSSQLIGNYGKEFTKLVNTYKKQIKEIEKSGLSAKKEQKILQQAETASQNGKYAEAHRLIFSVHLKNLPKRVTMIPLHKERNAMIARGEYRINCGEFDFTRLKSGQLFFPDIHAYEPGGWGYTIKGALWGPGIEVDIKNTEDDILYLRQAYSVNSYKFTVKPGIFTVRLHFNKLFKPSFKAGVDVFHVDLEGKRVLENFDIFKDAGNAGYTAVVKEFKGVEVKDAVLDIDFEASKQAHYQGGTLIHAIEVIPE